MPKFEIFLKPNIISKVGNPRAYDAEFSTEPYSKVFNKEHQPPTSPSYSLKYLNKNIDKHR
ncbi:MAG: hypothetical protein N3B21_03135 [Clostridia bacterium]|nr:hypothetical protein [Clostridia bacterium]